MMNNANEISHHTMLYGYIGEYAGQSSISATLNRLFKANNKDAMMIPMNIREDDLYYTLVNMKNSHVNGALIAGEYIKEIPQVLDGASDIVQRTGICDFIVREDKRLVGDILGIRALIELLKDKGCKKIALLGVDERVKAFTVLGGSFEISYFWDNLEELMFFLSGIGKQNGDVNRIAKGMSLDLGIYDAVVDFSDMDELKAVQTLSAINADLKHKKELSALKVRSNELGATYVGFEEMLDVISGIVYESISSRGHLMHDKSDMRF